MPHHATSLDTSELSDDEVAYLECEREYWGPSSTKEEVVLRRFGVGLPVYYQRLYRISATKAARRYDAVLVRRIIEVADEVTAQRLGKTGGADG